MKEFKEVKSLMLEKCKAKSACKSEFEKIVKADSVEDVIVVLRNNANWCRTNNLLTDEESISLFGLSLSNLFNSGDWNSGDRNSGDSNSGDRNSGNWNSGYRNSGNWNSGSRNSGNWNSGSRNSGDSNSGYRNSGDRNSGYSNSGYRNSGNRNSGNWNSGDRNSGDSNSGYRNSGAFCTDPDPKMILFDKETDMTVREWEDTECCRLMYNIDPNVWVPSSVMSEEEKELHPDHETLSGFLKRIPMKEAWADFWGNLSDEKKELFTSLPNFDAKKFEEITGIVV